MILLLSITAIAQPISELQKPTNYVSDYAEIFSPQEKQEIESLIIRTEKNTTAEIAIVTVKSLERMTEDQYAVELFEKWGIGKKDKDNGLLILIAPNERKYRIEVGYGLEGTITDLRAGIIARENFVENFQQEKYGTGIYESLLDIKGLLEEDPTIVSEYKNTEKSMNIKSREIYFWIIIFFIIMFLSPILKSTLKKKNKKAYNFTSILIGIAGALFIAFLISIAFGAMFFFIYLMIAFTQGRGGGPIFFGPGRGFGGGGLGGGFGGFGGGASGGGGSGGGW